MWKPSCSMRIDGQTDTTNVSRFPNFANMPKKLQCLICVIDAVHFLQVALKFVVYLVLEELCAYGSVMLK
jgi:uncharacterized membrane protein YqhA